LLRRLWGWLTRLVRKTKASSPGGTLRLQLRGWFAEQLSRSPGVPIQTIGAYAHAVSALLERLPPDALTRLRQNTTEVRFYATFEELTVDLARVEPKVRERMARGEPVGGAYSGARRCLYLDGGDDETPNRDILNLYAHEFVHAIDGPGRLLSSSRAWTDAWQAEIRDKEVPLTPTAVRNPQEGFAEFGRVLYAEVRSRDWLEGNHTRCADVWKGIGLW
jgi:hypothetical protein